MFRIWRETSNIFILLDKRCWFTYVWDECYIPGSNVRTQTVNAVAATTVAAAFYGFVLFDFVIFSIRILKINLEIHIQQNHTCDVLFRHVVALCKQRYLSGVAFKTQTSRIVDEQNKNENTCNNT